MTDATKLIEYPADVKATIGELKSAFIDVTIHAQQAFKLVALIEQQAARIAALESAAKAEPIYLPCPICKGVEGCDHTVPERRRAAEKPVYQQRVAGFNAAWRDVSKECFDECSSIDTFEARIVYTAPAPLAQPLEAQADARDAWRYRWLRDWQADASDFCCASLEIFLPVPARDTATAPRKHSECFDAAIDAAMSQKSGEQE